MICMNNNIATPFWNNITQWANLGNTPNTNNATQMNSQQVNTNTPQSNESRENMIRRLYKVILGREADQAGLNYFLRSNLTEHEIAKEMYESTEHVDILNKAKDVRNVLLKYEEALEKIKFLEHKLSNTEISLAKYKELLQNESIRNNYTQQSENNDNTLNTNLNSINTGSKEQEPPEIITLEDPFANDKKNNNLLNIFKDWFRFD